MDAVTRPPFAERALTWLKKEALPLLVMLGLLAAGVPPQVQQRFDWVGWDPRGIGLSQPQLTGCIEAQAQARSIAAYGTLLPAGLCLCCLM